MKALKDKRSGELVILKKDNPLLFLTQDQLASGDYLPEHMEIVEVQVDEKRRR